MPLEVGRRHSLLCAHAYGEPTIPLHNNLFNCFVNDMKFNVLHHHLLTNGPIQPILARIKASLKLSSVKKLLSIQIAIFSEAIECPLVN